MGRRWDVRKQEVGHGGHGKDAGELHGDGGAAEVSLHELRGERRRAGRRELGHGAGSRASREGDHGWEE
jgi:hypothetical protein